MKNTRPKEMCGPAIYSILSPYSNHTVSDIFWIATWECFLRICQYLFNTCVYVWKLTLYFCILCTMMLLCFIHFVNIASFGCYLCSPLPWCWRVLVATLVSIWCSGTYFRVMFLTRSGEGQEWPLTISKLASPPELFSPVYSSFITFNWSTLGAVYSFSLKLISLNLC